MSANQATVSAPHQPCALIWSKGLFALELAFFAFALFALTACGDTINPVRYQPVEVLLTRPCFAGKAAPAQAVLLTDPVCTLPTNAECIRAAAADINELKREVQQSRNLIRECLK